MSSSLDWKLSYLPTLSEPSVSSPSSSWLDTTRKRAASLPAIGSESCATGTLSSFVLSSTSTLLDPNPNFEPRRRAFSLFHHSRSTDAVSDKSERKEREKITSFQHTPGYHTTRDRVAEAAHSVIGNSGLVVHELLSVSSDLLRLAPVLGLAEVARTLLNIWDALQLVDTNRKGWLRLMDRCASVLISVRLEILESGGDAVSEELKPALDNLTMAFQDVFRTAQAQQTRTFLKRYLRREEIEHALGLCHKQLDEALVMFNTSIQVRILKQVMYMEKQHRANTSVLLRSISHNGNTNKLLPCSGTIHPPMTPLSPSPAISGCTTSLCGSLTPDTLPTPKADDDTKRKASPASHWQPKHGCEVDGNLAAHDMADLLRQLMRAALETSDDVEMMHVLQVGHDAMPAVAKALQCVLTSRAGAGSGAGV